MRQEKRSRQDKAEERRRNASAFIVSLKKGYRKTKKLLKGDSENEYWLSVAYIDKALSWSTIKADDSKGLNALVIFLSSCNNAMLDLDYMEELDNACHCQ